MKRTLLFLFITFLATNLWAKGNNDQHFQGTNIIVEYSIEKTNEGSRSEGRTHLLKINGYEVPYHFDIIYAQREHYMLKQSDQLWGDTGYMKTEEPKPFEESSRALSNTIFETGWYESDKRYKNTPETWVYLYSEGMISAFVSPEKIEAFIAQLNK